VYFCYAAADASVRGAWITAALTIRGEITTLFDMAHFIGIKQPNGQISPVLDFDNNKPVKLSLMPAREGQDKVLIPFFYVDTEHSEYTIPLGSYTINYKKKPSLKQDKLALHLSITDKGKLKVILAAPGGKAKTFDVFKHLKKKQRSQKVKPAPKPTKQPQDELSPDEMSPEGLPLDQDLGADDLGAGLDDIGLGAPGAGASDSMAAGAGGMVPGDMPAGAEGMAAAGGAGAEGMAAAGASGGGKISAAAKAPAKGRIGGFKLVLIIIYGIILAALVFFLLTQTVPELSLERLFGIRL